MNKRLIFWLSLIFPLMVFAADGSNSSQVSFAPPASDYSIGWLADIFGIVDGVLHGTGSQIIGQMFEIFNAAVMALGGIIITYTMIVSTMNTAHEGEMLGKKWSSIWVPVRATVGFTFLVPKASGYCMLQIFVMWVVVQGVGAADKLWTAALNYLNRGGVIIATQNPTEHMFKETGGQQLAQGAITILSGQVCMLAVEKILQNQLIQYQKPHSDCANTSNPALKTFCTSGTVPSFANTVDFRKANDTAQKAYYTQIQADITAYEAALTTYGTELQAMETYQHCVSQHNTQEDCSDAYGGEYGGGCESVPATAQQIQSSCGTQPATPVKPTTSAYNPTSMVELPLPNFSSDSALFPLNGICGKIKWNLFSFKQQIKMLGIGLEGNTEVQGQNSFSPGELSVAQNARAIALQQMYSDLLPVAQMMVTNDPDPSFSSSNAYSSGGTTKAPNLMDVSSDNKKAKNNNAYDWAKQHFGQTLDGSGNVCTSSSQNCTNWGTPATAGSDTGGAGALLTGTEITDSILDYMGVIKPTLTLIADADNLATSTSAKEFIKSANESGWIMAGTYFFNLVQLNQLNTTSSGGVTTDNDSGVESSTFDLQNLSASFTGDFACSDDKVSFCNLVKGDASVLSPIFSLFTGVATPVVDSGKQVATANPTQFDHSIIKTNPIPATSSASPPKVASSVFGYAQNALVIHVPGQPPMPVLQFANKMNISTQQSPITLPNMSFPCNGFHLFTEICIGRYISTAVYYGLLYPLMNWVMTTVGALIYSFVMICLMAPLEAIGVVFKQSVEILSQPGINPIVALAQMGVFYINFVGELWMVVLLGQLIIAIASFIGIPILISFALILPIMTAWTAVMLSVGFVTAYYIPFIPYMIFTFGALAWFMAVVEAMVAAPIVALGVMHPEGHDIFGKGEAAIMILMNVFLRPAMMIIGLITAISISYVGIWLLNAGFDRAIGFMQPSSSASGSTGTPLLQQGWGYTGWSGIFAYFFSILIYTTMYMTLVEKAFSLISALPDKVLRWIGGQPESHGQETAQWMGEAKRGSIEKAEQEGATGKAIAAGSKGAESTVEGYIPEAGGGGVKAEKGKKPPKP
jgi:defect-in-organelle-trafficking protein DotA